MLFSPARKMAGDLCFISTLLKVSFLRQVLSSFREKKALYWALGVNNLEACLQISLQVDSSNIHPSVPRGWGTLSFLLYSWVVVFPLEVKSSPTVSSQAGVMLSVQLVCLVVVEANLGVGRAFHEKISEGYGC